MPAVIDQKWIGRSTPTTTLPSLFPMARLYSNENFPKAAVEALRSLGHDVLTTVEAGNANQAIPDEDVVRYAVKQQRVVLTLNRQDFISLHRSDPDHSGIIVCTFNPDFAALASKIHHALESCPAMSGQLLRVNRGS